MIFASRLVAVPASRLSFFSPPGFIRGGFFLYGPRTLGLASALAWDEVLIHEAPLRRLLLAVVGLLLLAGCLEGVVRAFGLVRPPYAPPPPLERALRRSRTTTAPGSRTSADGRRGNPFRVLVVGDSVVRGDGVRPGETVGDRLLAGLERRHGGRAWQVDNAGVGTGGIVGVRITRRELEFVERFGLALHPDLLLLGIYVGNDLEDHDDVKPVNGVPQSGRLRSAHTWLLNDLRSYAFLHDRLYEVASTWGLRKPLMADFDSIPSLVRGDPLAVDGVEHCLKTVGTACREAGREGVSSAVFIMPLRAQVYPERCRNLERWYGIKLSEENLRLPNKMLTEGLAKQGIPCLDLMDPFRRSGNQDLYLDRDMHWTVSAHRLAAELIEAFIEQEGLLESSAASQPLRAARIGD